MTENVLVVATFWLNYEHLSTPRIGKLQTETVQAEHLSRGVAQVMALIALSFMRGSARAHPWITSSQTTIPEPQRENAWPGGTNSPHDQKGITYTGDALKKNWDALHKGDGEPFPRETALQDAWRAFMREILRRPPRRARARPFPSKPHRSTPPTRKKDAAKVKLFQDAMAMAEAPNEGTKKRQRVLPICLCGGALQSKHFRGEALKGKATAARSRLRWKRH